MLDENTRRAGGLALAVVSAATFGTSGSFAYSLAQAGWSPGAAVAARVGVASLILLAPALLALRGRRRALRRNGPTIVLYGLVAVAGCQVFFFNAIQRLSVGVAMLVEYLGVVLVVGWMWLRHGHAPRRLTLVGSVAAIAGLALVIDLGGDTKADLVGLLWALGGAVGLATYYILSARGGEGLPPVALAGGGMAVGALVLLLLGALGALPMHATFGTVDLAGHRASWLVPIVGLAVLAGAVGYVTGIGAARRLGPKLATFVGLTEVIFAMLVAWLLLGQLPTMAQLAGGTLIVGGVALVRLDEMAPSAPSRQPVLDAG